jgi:hypothetical protein
MKVIFAGKFVWFILAALAFFFLFAVQSVYNQAEINEGLIYNLLLFPSILLDFYPAVFGIQNDEDARTFELLIGIPDYKYKVWGLRLVMIYIAVFFILILFSFIAVILLYPVNLFEMSAQLMLPVLFYGNMAFMLSTVTRSGNGTAVITIIISIVLIIFSNNLERTFWNILLNPFSVPNNLLPIIWSGIVMKNRILLICCSIIWMMIGLLNLQKREKFI